MLCMLGLLAACRLSARAGELPPLPRPSPETASAGESPTEMSGPREAVSLEDLSDRLRAMEELNRKLAEELERTRKEHDEQIRLILYKLNEGAAAPRAPSPPPGEEGMPGEAGGPGTSEEEVEDRQSVDIQTPVPDYTEGQLAPSSPPPGYPRPGAPRPSRLPLLGTFGPGFSFQTEDEKFRLMIHYESQIEGRVWDPSDQEPANSGIFLPRQRIFFTGNITKPIEYEFAINRGFGGLNLLNAFVNIHFDDRFEVRLGRYFTPMFYEQYAISNYWLLAPERSVFTTNLSLNRQFGMMAWGYLLDKRLDYAAGVFNGSRNSFESFNNGADFVGYLNARPFQQSESLDWLNFLNVGSSVAFGYQDQSPVPVSFRIAGGSPSADVPGPATMPFLILNRDVIERGDRLIGAVHAAYFRKSLSLVGEWQYGYGGYALPRGPSTRLPFSGFYVAGGYFLTGEEVERRTRLYPRRPFLPTKAGARRGPGAWEAVARVGQLTLGEEVFSAGLANRDLWSNQATTTEVGLNWYWNEYIKLYLFWLHGDFADPVHYRPGERARAADMFWLRFQLYF